MNLTELEKEKLVEYLGSLILIVKTYDIEELINERDKYCYRDIEIIEEIIKKMEGGKNE